MRMTTRIAAGVAGAALLAGAAAVPATAKSPWTKTGATTIGTAVAASGGVYAFDTNSNDFDILIAAILGTGADALFDGTEYTVFAPTDGAFIALADALDGAPAGSITTEAEAVPFWVGVLGTEKGQALVTKVLLYHVVAGTLPAASVTTGRSITTVGGESFRYAGGVLDGINSDAGIVKANLKTTDGAIHVIDTVLLPTIAPSELP